MRSRSVLALWCGLAGCGRVGFDARGGTDARESVDAPLQDGAVDAVLDPLAPWGPAELVTLPTIGNDDDPSLTSDQLEMVFERGQDLYVTTRATVTSPWSSPTILASLSTLAEETTPELSRDDLTLYFASMRGGGAGGRDLYVSQRASRGAAWGAPVRVSELATSGDEYAGVPTEDQLQLLYTGPGPDLREATRASTATTWGAPRLLSELNTGGDDSSANVSPDGLVIYFQSDRGGDFDLYVATRPSVSATFGPPTRIDSLSVAGEDDEDPWVTADGRRIYFSAVRGGTRRLYTASR